MKSSKRSPAHRQKVVDDAELKESEEKFELALETLVTNRHGSSYRKLREQHNVN